MAHAMKRNMFGLNAFCTGWGSSVLTGGTNWTTENSTGIGRAFSCPLALDSISVSATLFKFGPRGLV